MSDPRFIFHLSIPVSDLMQAREFYCEVLGAKPGRETDEWCDVLLWGHQITLQCRPDEVLPADGQGKRHFGVVLPWETWQNEVRRIQDSAYPISAPAKIFNVGLADEQAKIYLTDPSHNIIEIKAYRHIEQTIGLPS